MKTIFLAIPLAMAAATAFCQSSPSARQAVQPNPTALIGIWHGQGVAQETGLPFVTLTLADDNGSLTGAILLFVAHLDHGRPVVSPPGTPEPILHPRFDGQTLTFQVNFRGPLPPGVSPSDPVLTYHLKMALADKGELTGGSLAADAQAITGSSIPLGAPIQMARTMN